MPTISYGRVNTLLLVLLVLMTAGIIAILATRAVAGPLDPESPPGSTMKTLEEIEPRIPISTIPYVIGGPGSYYLTQNLTLTEPSPHGILVQSADVVLDLNGFTIDGSGLGARGVQANTQSTIVRNGVARGWTDAGFWILSSASKGENLTAIGNATGIRVQDAVLTDCVVFNNSVYGVQAFASTVEGCKARSNGIGFSLNQSSLRNCQARLNTNAGIDAEAQSLVESCVSIANFYGILARSSNIRGNTVSQNGGDGIRAIADNLIADNVAYFNGTTGAYSGIFVLENNNRIVRNNTSFNDGGISALGGFNTIDDNSALDNSLHGFSIGGSKNTVIRNSATGNGPDAAILNFSIAAGNNPGPVVAAASATNPLSNTQ